MTPRFFGCLAPPLALWCPLQGMSRKTVEAKKPLPKILGTFMGWVEPVAQPATARVKTLCWVGSQKGGRWRVSWG
jgi:hypothetical protein